MTDRILDISQEPVALSVQNDQLVIRRAGRGEQTPAETAVPLEELGVVVVSHPAVSYTQAVLTGIAERGGVLIVCDRKHQPSAMLMPLTGHHLQAERFDRQAHASLPTRKRLWQQIVRAKIKAQGRLLLRLRGQEGQLEALLPTVRSGDPHNVEAAAARKYWAALFGPDFRRDPEAEDQNRNLNYGYAVLSATVARAICAAGLHPSLGLHHHNRYNAFCLASDLTEPFRPVVDAAVFEWIANHEPASPLDTSAKEHLLKTLTARYNIGGEWRTLFDALSRTAASLAHVFEGTAEALDLPDI